MVITHMVVNIMKEHDTNKKHKKMRVLQIPCLDYAMYGLRVLTSMITLCMPLNTSLWEFGRIQLSIRMTIINIILIIIFTFELWRAMCEAICLIIIDESPNTKWYFRPYVWFLLMSLQTLRGLLHLIFYYLESLS